MPGQRLCQVKGQRAASISCQMAKMPQQNATSCSVQQLLNSDHNSPVSSSAAHSPPLNILIFSASCTGAATAPSLHQQVTACWQCAVLY